MKKILGLDLGSSSIGWAMVNEAESNEEISSIIKLGVRTVKYDNFVSSSSGKESKDPEKDFLGGKGISPNAGRTAKRSARRNLQRYKLRRESLIECLKSNGLITYDSVLTEVGNRTTFETYMKRAAAARERIELTEFARVLLQINKKRGYKSSRKAKGEEEGQLIDGMSIAKRLYDENITPGEYTLELLRSGKKYIPEFYRSDLRCEIERVWEKQKQYYEDILSDALYNEIEGKNKTQTWKVLEKPFGIVGMKREKKGEEQRMENYEWRKLGLYEKLGLEELAIVLQEINGQLNNSSGYLGKISDRSKKLYFDGITIGEYQMAKLAVDPHYSLKNEIFYRQDYMDEFELIWEEQAKHHKELTKELKHEIRDIIIFYQRPLKSQKWLINFCEFESKEIEVLVDGKKKVKKAGSRVCPRSSPLFQECKIWQILNNIELKGNVVVDENPQLDIFGEVHKDSMKKGVRSLDEEEKAILFKELQIKDKISKKDALKLLFKNADELDMNYKEIDGNRTQAELFKAYAKIIAMSGHGEYKFEKMAYDDVIKIVGDIFSGLGFATDILTFDSNKIVEQEPMYKLWHLLYSFEGDKSSTGNEKLISALCNKYGFDREYAMVMANVSFMEDYGSLSTKAIKKILPYLKDGNQYDVSCEYAGYRHSRNSLTKEEIENRALKDELAQLPKNSLRNPVVEKILNQMVNVVNAAIKEYGKPDEIRIELARELKKGAKEKEDTIKAISKATGENERIRAIIKKEFGFTHISRNDIIRYRLYEELKENGYKTLYSGTYISKDKIFSKEFDIEHIIPQAKLFDDSFSNKTLELRSINIEKGSKTARDFVFDKYGKVALVAYENKIDTLFVGSKKKKLLMSESDIPQGFIERDLRETQYIAKKAKAMLEEVARRVVSTTGSVTDRLREDWQLIDVMQELNWEKYDRLGLTEVIVGKDGQRIKRIKDWTKRNDHRHHAMDALTIAFTKHSYIQYLNNLNARVGRDKLENGTLGNKDKEISSSVYAIEQKELERDKNNKLRFIAPMPNMRAEAEKALKEILISIKEKNKVVTKNINKITHKGKTIRKEQLTPRGQLHNETIYGHIRQYVTKEESVGSSFSREKIMTVSSKKYRELLLERLAEHNGDAKKAFGGKNALSKNPIYIDKSKTQEMPSKVKTTILEDVYTIRKPINSDLKVDKVIDVKIKSILNDRLKEFDGDNKKAFSNIEENPIWLNKEKGIAIKSVTIKGANTVVPLHDKRDHMGELLLDENGNKQATDYVNTGNNHHVAVYRDEDGNVQEKIVSFYEATMRANEGLPIVNKEFKKEDGWEFLYTMKQNEYFVFPRYETKINENGEEESVIVFDPKDIDLMDEGNYSLVSKNLFRVQKFSYKNYVFRHHLETTVDANYTLRDITWSDFRSSKGLDSIVKVRIDHIGRIVSIGEY